MRVPKIIAAAACAGLLGSSAFATVRPAPAPGLMVAPPVAMAGTRLGSTTFAERSNAAGSSALIMIAAAAAVGLGAAAGAGAFNHDDYAGSP